MKTKQLSCCLALTLLAVSAWADPYRHEDSRHHIPGCPRRPGQGRGKWWITKPGEYRLGISVRYGSPASKVDVYLYTMGQDSIPGDLHAPLVKEHFMQASGGNYWGGGARGSTKTSRFCLRANWRARRPASCPCGAPSTCSRAGQDYRSYLYVATFHNHFLKVRYTILAESARRPRPRC